MKMKNILKYVFIDVGSTDVVSVRSAGEPPVGVLLIFRDLALCFIADADQSGKDHGQSGTLVGTPDLILIYIYPASLEGLGLVGIRVGIGHRTPLEITGERIGIQRIFDQAGIVNIHGLSGTFDMPDNA